MLEALAARAQRVPAWIRAIILTPALLVAGAVVTFCAVTDAPPWSWASNAQSDLLGGSYYPVLSAMCTLLAVMPVTILPAGILVHLIAFAYPPGGSSR